MKNLKPLVSVIIPTYNRGQVVKEAVDSVLAQSYDNFELIIVDDGSTDNTKELLTEYKNTQYQNQITILHQENKGVSAARNKGIKSASGHYISFLDSDDIWLEDKLSAQINFFNKNKTALICQTEEIWIRNGKRVNPKNRHKKESGDIFERSLELCLVSPSAVMLKKELFDEFGLFDESLPACEDYDLWLKVSSKYPVYTLENPNIIKRGGHSDQLSGMPGLDKYRIKSIVKLLGSGILNKRQYKSAVKILKSKCRIYAAGCKKRGRDEEAQSILEIADSWNDRKN